MEADSRIVCLHNILLTNCPIQFISTVMNTSHSWGVNTISAIQLFVMTYASLLLSLSLSFVHLSFFWFTNHSVYCSTNTLSLTQTESHTHTHTNAYPPTHRQLECNSIGVLAWKEHEGNWQDLSVKIREHWVFFSLQVMKRMLGVDSDPIRSDDNYLCRSQSA